MHAHSFAYFHYTGMIVIFGSIENILERIAYVHHILRISEENKAPHTSYRSHLTPETPEIKYQYFFTTPCLTSETLDRILALVISRMDCRLYWSSLPSTNTCHVLKRRTPRACITTFNYTHRCTCTCIHILLSTLLAFQYARFTLSIFWHIS